MTFIVPITSDHQIYNTKDQRYLLTKVLSDIASINGDAVFMAGDIVDKGDAVINNPSPLQGFLWADYFKYLRASGINLNTWYPLAGNHDASLNTVSEFTLHTRVPPVYGLTCGNVLFLFCGYEGWWSSQDVSQTMMDQVQHFLMKFEKTHNIILVSHSPIKEAGVFDYAPQTEGFRLRPQARWLSFFDNYSISAHFFGHSACDIVNADESTIVTHTSRVNIKGEPTHFFTTGPHIEQRHIHPEHGLGGRVVFMEEGATSFCVKTRDHLSGVWITEKEYNVPLRFPMKLDSKLTRVGCDAVHPYLPLMTATPKVVLGRVEANAPATPLVDKRRYALAAEWTDYFSGDLENQELLFHLSTPGDNVVTRGGGVQFGARRMSVSDTDISNEFVLYGTDAIGTETSIVMPREANGAYVFQGKRYPTSLQYPMVQASFEGVITPCDPLTISGWTELYDDFGQFNPTTGVFTCTQSGVYNFQGMIQFNGHPNAEIDLIWVFFTRIRAGIPTKYGFIEACLTPNALNSRDIINTPVTKIGLFAGETVTFNVEAWKSYNTNFIARAHITADMVRAA